MFFKHFEPLSGGLGAHCDDSLIGDKSSSEAAWLRNGFLVEKFVEGSDGCALMGGVQHEVESKPVLVLPCATSELMFVPGSFVDFEHLDRPKFASDCEFATHLPESSIDKFHCVRNICKVAGWYRQEYLNPGWIQHLVGDVDTNPHHGPCTTNLVGWLGQRQCLLGLGPWTDGLLSRPFCFWGLDG